MAGGEKILRSDHIFKLDGDQTSSKEKQVNIYRMKAMCFLLSDDQNRYIFLLKKLKDEENVGSDEYPVTTTSALNLLIHT